MKNSIISMQGIVNCFRATKKIILPLSLAIIIGFLGCSREFKRGMVYKEWTRTMSEEGIFPVFPPREDVQAGDIWLLPMHPYETKSIEKIGGLGKTGIWVTNILYEEIRAKGTSTTASVFYKNRFSFPSTTEAIKKAITKDAVHLADVPIMPVVTATNIQDVFTAGDCSRLRQVAFPEFTVTNITQANLNALVPIEYLSVALGFSFNKIGEVSLKIPSAESYCIPIKILTEDFFKTKSIEEIEENSGNGFTLKPYDYGTQTSPGIPGINYVTLKLARSQFNEAGNKLLAKGRLSDEIGEQSNYIWIAVVNEVYYARAIDMNIRKRRFGGGAANVQPITSKMLKELDRLTKIRASNETKTTETRPKKGKKKTPPEAEAGTASTEAGTTTPSIASPTIEDTEGRTIVENTEIKEEDDAFTLAKKINEYNKNLGNQSVPGGSVNVVSVSDTAVGLRRLFDRPIAVGVRGVIFKINLKESSEKELHVEEIASIIAKR